MADTAVAPPPENSPPALPPQEEQVNGEKPHKKGFKFFGGTEKKKEKEKSVDKVEKEKTEKEKKKEEKKAKKAKELEANQSAAPAVPSEGTVKRRGLFSKSGGKQVERQGTNDSEIDTPGPFPQGEPAGLSNSFSALQVAKKPPGLQGIVNHGNTCYINSVVQCLAHIDPLAHYFARDIFSKDLNSKKDGRKELTESFATIVRSLWKGAYAAPISQAFKVVLSTYKVEYKSREQQDAQEFLLYILDTMHEELNICKKAKPLKQRSVTAQTETAMSIENHALRNRSLFYQLFTGYQQCTVKCPVCQHTSTNTDPYTCLSLPIPALSTRGVLVTHTDLDGRLTRYGFTVNTADTVRQLRDMIAETLSSKNPKEPVSPLNLLLCELGSSGFRRTFKNQDPMGVLFDAQPLMPIFCIELRDPVCVSDEDDSSEAEDGEVKLARPDRAPVNGKPAFEADPNYVRLVFVHCEASKDDEMVMERFTGPWCLEVQLQMSYDELEDHILREIEDERDVEVPRDPQRRLTLHVVDGRHEGSVVLQPNLDMPLVGAAVDRAINYNVSGGSIRHLKVMVEWPTGLRAETVGYLPDEVEDDPSVSEVNEAAQNLNEKPLSLHDCLTAYLTPEKLEQEDAWNCPKCRKRHQITVNTSLYSTPDVLVIHFKRFKLQQSTAPANARGAATARNNKLSLHVDFPVEGLDVRPYLEPRNTAMLNQYALSSINRHPTAVTEDDFLYDLVAVCNHYGTMLGGHYIALAKNCADGKFYRFNDDRVEECVPASTVSPAAYILFYQRRSLLRCFNPSRSGYHWGYDVMGMVPPPPEPPKSDPISRRHLPGAQIPPHGGAGTLPRRQPLHKDHSRELEPAQPPTDLPIEPQPAPGPQDGQVTSPDSPQLRRPLRINVNPPPAHPPGPPGHLPPHPLPHPQHPQHPQHPEYPMRPPGPPNTFVYPPQQPYYQPYYFVAPPMAPQMYQDQRGGTVVKLQHSNIHVPNWRANQREPAIGKWVWKKGERVWSGPGDPPSE